VQKGGARLIYPDGLLLAFEADALLQYLSPANGTHVPVIPRKFPFALRANALVFKHFPPAHVASEIMPVVVFLDPFPKPLEKVHFLLRSSFVYDKSGNSAAFQTIF